MSMTMVVMTQNIKTVLVDGEDFICITDIAKIKNPLEPKDVVKNWMRTRNTLEYLGLWEKLNNPLFKGVEFDPLLAEAGANAFTMSPSRWIETTNAVGLIVKNGKNGGTFAQKDIAFKFASWVSTEFELYLIREFQRLKAAEQAQLGWSVKRELSKINYHIHTDAIKQNLIPAALTSTFSTPKNHIFLTNKKCNTVYGKTTRFLVVLRFLKGSPTLRAGAKKTKLPPVKHIFQQDTKNELQSSRSCLERRTFSKRLQGPRHAL